MNILKISIKNIRANWLTALLNILLVSFGVGIITVLLLASKQINNKLERDAKDIDLVVGAKGSPLQLILSSIFYIDFPTGNIPLKDANELAKNPMVKLAVPLALGDNYDGYRIAGTDKDFIKLYNLSLAAGKFWQNDFDVTVGSTVARSEHLKIGDHFYGAHGLTGQGDVHKSHAYVVTGILTEKGDVSDNIILTNVSSVWKMHEGKGPVINGLTEAYQSNDREITSLLICYRSPMAVVLFPRLVNQSTSMQAASPAMESARLFSLIGVGVDTLQWFAMLIIIISAVSVFVSLYNALKERKYDIAILRIMGASKLKMFLLIIAEGAILTFTGTLLGLALGHLAVQFIGIYQDSAQAKLNGMLFLPQEINVVIGGLAIGLIAAFIPAVQAYRSNISQILAQE